MRGGREGHAYMAGGMCGVCIGGYAWQMRGCVQGRRDGHCSRRYASYWNTFLFSILKVSIFKGTQKNFY